MAKKVMDVEEQTMRDFKLKYYNEMPEQRAGNLERLNRLNEQSQRLQESIQNLERTKIMAQEQSAMMQRLMAVRSAGEQAAQALRLPLLESFLTLTGWCNCDAIIVHCW